MLHLEHYRVSRTQLWRKCLGVWPGHVFAPVFFHDRDPLRSLVALL